MGRKTGDPIASGAKALVGESGPGLIISEGTGALMTPVPLDGARYLGDGSAFISGVPTRDLSGDEWAALSDDLQALCLGSGLYEAHGTLTVPEDEGHAAS